MEQNVQDLNIQAINLAVKGEFSEAISCLKAALKLDSRNFRIWYNLGVTYRDSGDLEKALEALRTAYEINPDDESVLETLSLLCFNKEDIDNAFGYALEAISGGMANYRIWNNFGVYLFSEGQYEDAAEAFENALEMYPHYYDALINLRDTYDELGNTCGRDECTRKIKELGFR